MQSHTMELPRLIEIGEKNIGDFGKFLNSLNRPKKVSLICGTNVQKVLKIKVEKSLKIKKIQYVWHTSIDNQIKSINKIEKNVKKDNSEFNYRNWGWSFCGYCKINFLQFIYTFRKFTNSCIT